MDNEPEVIREQMAETRASLADKIESLEGTEWPQAQRGAAASWEAEERHSAAARASAPSTPHQGLTSLFGPELAKFRGLAIGYLMGAVRDAISEALPRDMRSQVHETM